jgi:hypothetical protein
VHTPDGQLAYDLLTWHEQLAQIRFVTPWER